METKHTPGPWKSDNHGVRHVGGYICALNWPSRYDGQDERFKREMAERDEDARLIARAPDLLTERDTLQARVAELEAALTDVLLHELFRSQRFLSESD